MSVSDNINTFSISLSDLFRLYHCMANTSDVLIYKVSKPLVKVLAKLSPFPYFIEMESNNHYLVCDHTKRPKPNFKISEDVAKAIGRDYRTLPIFEKGLYEYINKKKYSLDTNEFLKCRWLEYKKNIDSRVFAPFQFIDIRDYHFYNCRNRFIPAQSITKKGEYRFKLKPGPGVDFCGQMPIPQDLYMKRGDTKKIKSKKYQKIENGGKKS